MRAVLIEQADVAGAIAECDEILTQEAHALRIATGRELVAHQRRDPIPPHHLPHRGFRPDAAQQLVLFACQHMLTPGSISCGGSGASLLTTQYADGRRERNADPGRTGDADGRAATPLLASDRCARGASRSLDQACPAARRGPGSL